jgi:hypothetical protein
MVSTSYLTPASAGSDSPRAASRSAAHVLLSYPVQQYRVAVGDLNRGEIVGHRDDRQRTGRLARADEASNRDIRAESSVGTSAPGNRASGPRPKCRPSAGQDPADGRATTGGSERAGHHRSGDRHSDQPQWRHCAGSNGNIAHNQRLDQHEACQCRTPCRAGNGPPGPDRAVQTLNGPGFAAQARGATPERECVPITGVRVTSVYRASDRGS